MGRAVLPGLRARPRVHPWVTDPLGPFQPADNDAFWFRAGLHFGGGIAPASVALLDDAQTLGTQTAAEIVGVPPSKGSVDRFIGTTQGGTWWAELEAFLEVYGQRMEETCMMETAPWVEDPAPALHKLDAILRNPDDHDFEVAQREAIETRDAYVEAAREELGGGEELAQFNEMLATNQAANFAWWNDEHNALIDRRIAIPVRRLTLALAPHLVEEGRISEPTDMFFIFKHELYDAMGGDEAEWKRLKALIPSVVRTTTGGASAVPSCHRWSGRFHPGSKTPS